MSEHRAWTAMRRRRLGRRALLGASARAGVGAAGLALVGCGDDDDDDDQAVAETPAQQEQQAQQQAEQVTEPEEQAEEPAEEPAEQAGEQTETPAQQTGPTPGGTSRAPLVGLSSGNPPTLDPFENLTYRAQIPAGYHYSKLLRYIRGGPGVDPLNFAEVEGDGAKVPEIPDDGTTFVFELQDNFRWQDVDPLNGRDVTVDDIVFTEQRFRDISANALSWGNVVDRLEPIDERTFQIKLVRPFAPFFNLLGSPEHLKLIPPEIVEDGTAAERPVGSGPWIFERFEPDVEIVWRKNPDWYETGFPLLDGHQASMVADASTIIANLAGGEFDYSLLSATVFEAAEEQVPDLEFIFNGNQVFGGSYFNFSNEPWGDPRVRQAWSLAQDRAGILSAQDQTGQGGWFSAISQLAPFWLDPQDRETFGRNVEFFHRDVERARQLLDAAGYPDGLDVIVNGTQGYGDAFTQLFELIAATAGEAGFRTQFAFKEYAAYIATTFIGDMDEGMAIGPLKVAVEPDDIFFTNYHPDSGRKNWGAGPGDPSEDTELLAKFDEQRGELDLDRRIELINEIQRDMAESMYIVPYIANPGVTGRMPHVEDFWYKSSFAFGTETLPYVWMSNV